LAAEKMQGVDTNLPGLASGQKKIFVGTVLLQAGDFFGMWFVLVNQLGVRGILKLKNFNVA